MAENIEVSDNPGSSRFEILVDGEVAGFAQYRRRPHKIFFTHTEVRPEFEGMGLGSRLAAGALDQSRASALPVVPLCPFIARYIRRHPEYKDLVHEDYLDLVEDQA
ncbi:GNAT family N-acetyltransferase [Streptosporangium lutulentum]|uniref:GNAT family acetyltransferase n=1 Tax=Streptosporangium lutulentum TaxID=1461250 RepID=A0ABT9QSE6_9ACTN|nr:GNAT family N-acetyltransferase [Streptosporangium lutulentum]MDP9848959.1 putative GNAT family acetyltransferase [Streptosporangium lutulentum]